MPLSSIVTVLGFADTTIEGQRVSDSCFKSASLTMLEDLVIWGETKPKRDVFFIVGLQRGLESFVKVELVACLDSREFCVDFIL